MWLNTVDVYSPTTHSCKPATSLPKECAYGSAVVIGNKLFYVGGGNGIDWFSSMLQLPLDDPEGDWEQVPCLVSHSELSSFSCMWQHAEYAVAAKHAVAAKDAVAAKHAMAAKQVWTLGCHMAQ